MRFAARLLFQSSWLHTHPTIACALSNPRPSITPFGFFATKLVLPGSHNQRLPSPAPFSTIRGPNLAVGSPEVTSSTSIAATPVFKSSRIVVLGAAALDICPVAQTIPGDEGSRSVKLSQYWDTAAHNIALSISKLTSARVTLIAPVGDDSLGVPLRQQLGQAGIDLRTLSVSKEERTATADYGWIADIDFDEIIEDMSIARSVTSKAMREALESFKAEDEEARTTVVMDAHLSSEAITEVLAIVKEWNNSTASSTHLVYDSTDPIRCDGVLGDIENLAERFGPLEPRPEFSDTHGTPSYGLYDASRHNIGVDFCTIWPIELKIMWETGLEMNSGLEHIPGLTHCKPEDEETRLLFYAFVLMPLLGKKAMFVKHHSKGVFVIRPKYGDPQEDLQVMLVPPPVAHLSNGVTGITLTAAIAAACAQKHPDLWSQEDYKRIVKSVDKAGMETGMCNG